jgi:hypothetical protein
VIPHHRDTFERIAHDVVPQRHVDSRASSNNTGRTIPELRSTPR